MLILTSNSPRSDDEYRNESRENHEISADNLAEQQQAIGTHSTVDPDLSLTLDIAESQSSRRALKGKFKANESKDIDSARHHSDTSTPVAGSIFQSTRSEKPTPATTFLLESSPSLDGKLSESSPVPATPPAISLGEPMIPAGLSATL